MNFTTGLRLVLVVALVATAVGTATATAQTSTDATSALDTNSMLIEFTPQDSSDEPDPCHVNKTFLPCPHPDPYP